MLSTVTGALAAILVLTTALATEAKMAPREQRRFLEKARPQLAQGCAGLVDQTWQAWRDFERASGVTCFESKYLPKQVQTDLRPAFIRECTKHLLEMLKRQTESQEETGEFNFDISGVDKMRMLAKPYLPVYRRYCASKNPGRILPDLEGTPPSSDEEPFGDNTEGSVI